MGPVLEVAGGVRIKLYLQPRSSRNQVVGLHQDMVKIKLMAPPVEGAANDACIAYLSELLSVSKSSIHIISGAASRRKVVEIMGVSKKDVESVLKLC